jgi:hypothetical protein
MRILLPIIALTLAGCASHATLVEREKTAEQPWHECVVRAIERLDDGKSDPLSISYGIEPVCSAESARLAKTLIERMATADGQRYSRARWKHEESKLIVNAVLNHRASHSARANSDENDNGNGGIGAKDSASAHASQTSSQSPDASEFQSFDQWRTQGNAK